MDFDDAGYRITFRMSQEKIDVFGSPEKVANTIGLGLSLIYREVRVHSVGDPSENVYVLDLSGSNAEDTDVARLRKLIADSHELVE